MDKALELRVSCGKQFLNEFLAEFNSSKKIFLSELLSTKPKIIGYNELLRLVHYNRQGEGYYETKKPKRYAKFHYI